MIALDALLYLASEMRRAAFRAEARSRERLLRVMALAPGANLFRLVLDEDYIATLGVLNVAEADARVLYPGAPLSA
jgi:hypothetical protein